MARSTGLFLGVAGLSMASLARAQEAEPAGASPSATVAPDEAQAEDQASNEFDLLKTDRLTGNWGGARTFLEERGVTLNLSMTNIYQHNAHGGLRTHNAHRVSGSYDLELTLDTEAMNLWKGGMIYAIAEGSWDEGVSDRGYVGDLFGVNGDAAGDEEIQLSELWYEHSFLDDKLRVRFGKLDLTVDFDTNAFANDETAQFLNGGLGNTGNIPFPDPGHGVQFVATPCEWFYFGAGVADAEANVKETGFNTTYHGRNDFFSIYEFGITPTWNTGWGKLPGSYRVGLWYDPQDKDKFFDDLGGRRRQQPSKRDDTGFYTSVDQVIFRENPQVDGDEQGLGFFCRYGYAHEDVNLIEHFWSVGGQYQGLIPTRDDDVLAFGVAQGILSDDLRLTGARPHRETVLELYYRAQVLPWLALTPDFQWILGAGGEHGPDAFVAGLRLQMAF
jgi:porin